MENANHIVKTCQGTSGDDVFMFPDPRAEIIVDETASMCLSPCIAPPSVS